MQEPKHIHIKKGSIIEVAGELNPKLYEVKRGLLRSYTIDKKGKEHIFLFAPEGWFIADNIYDSPSELFIDAIEDSEVCVTEKGELISDHLDKFSNRLSVLQRRITMLMSASTIERYDYFIETYPKIVQRVPQRMIASYLGITPEALSKVKSQNKRNSSSTIS
ncbi:MAG: Crp/Fnr family transcriptional regulator [Bacteroidia bacterium]|nr:Crp/Fnr family transcriptional regulator [Bacteroidia bacterium]